MFLQEKWSYLINKFVLRNIPLNLMKRQEIKNLPYVKK